MPDRPARGQAFRRADDRPRVDAVMAVEVRQGPGLAKVLDAERAYPMPCNRAEPRKRRGWPSMTVTKAA